MNIENKPDLVQYAKGLPREVREKILTSFKETEIHGYLKNLFSIMEPDYIIEITHKASELGKDLVIVKKDKMTIDVIAVVVKCGDIKAKTAGDVDEIGEQIEVILKGKSKKILGEIESQVKQALEHPAEMKSCFKELPVGKIFIVLVGGISSHVRKRMKVEIEPKGNIEIFDINWLIENMTAYYPEIFFEGGHIVFFEKQLQVLERKYCISKLCKKNLSEYFIEPVVAAADLPIKLDKVDKETLELIINKKKVPFSELRDLLRKSRHLILIGDPGIGKTGALAKLAIDMFKAGYHQVFKGAKRADVEIPLLITAKELISVADVNGLFEKVFEHDAVIKEYKVAVLMVDALDEVPAVTRKELIEKAKRFADELSCSLVITSRKIDVVNAPPAGFEKYELLPFEFSLAVKLIEKVVPLREHFQTLKKGLEQIKNQVPMSPLSLMLLVQLVEEHKEIPASVTELYDRFVDEVLGKWDKDKGIEVLFEYILKKKFLASLAYHEFLKKGRLEVPKEDFDEFTREYARKFGWDMTEFVKEVERAGILAISGHAVFRHRSFLDFFVAFYIYEKRAELGDVNDLIVKLYFDDFWGEVAFFYVGLIREISETIMGKIFAYDKDNLSVSVDKFLCGRLLQAGWHSPTETRSSGIEKAIAFAPLIREQFLGATQEGKVKLPRIFGDFLVLTLSDISFNSGFLLKEIKELLDKYLGQSSKENLYMTTVLLWSIQRFLNGAEIEEAVTKLLETVTSSKTELGAEDQARLLLFLIFIEQGDKEITKVIRRKINKLKKRYPDMFKSLLPSRTKKYLKG